MSTSLILVIIDSDRKASSCLESFLEVCSDCCIAVCLHRNMNGMSCQCLHKTTLQKWVCPGAYRSSPTAR